MTVDTQKELFSLAYVRAIAAVCGASATKPEVDDDSVDLAFQAKPRAYLEAQVKCADRSLYTVTSTHIHYPLKIKNFNDLSDINVPVSRILIVMLVPPVVPSWVVWSHNSLNLHNAAYWMSLRGMVTQNAANVTVQVPLMNEFSVLQLSDIFNRIRTGGCP